MHLTYEDKHNSFTFLWPPRLDLSLNSTRLDLSLNSTRLDLSLNSIVQD